MNRIYIVENDVNKTSYDDDMQPGMVRLAETQQLEPQSKQQQQFEDSKDSMVQPMMVTVDSCASMDELVAELGTPRSATHVQLQLQQLAGALRIKTTDLTSAATTINNIAINCAAAGVNQQVCAGGLTGATSPMGAVPCSPMPSVVMSVDGCCGASTFSGSEVVAQLSDVTDADLCAGVLGLEESSMVMEIAAGEEGSFYQAKPAESDLAEMKDAGYWKDVSQFKQSVFDKLGARHVPLSLNTEDTVKMFLRESDLGEDPFYVLDLSRLVRQYMQWR